MTFSLGLILFMSHPAWAARINFAPLFSYESDDSGYDLSIAGPLLEFTSDSQAVRPLFYKDDSRADVLYPLGRSTKEKSYFVPLFRHSDQKDEESTNLLVFFYGKSQDEKYGGFFPLYGTLRNRFGHDRLRFVLWPLYTEMTDDDRTTYSILWPFLKYSSGREFQFFPVYGYEKTINYRHDYFLWPLIHHRRGVDNIDAFLPFFFYSRDARSRGISILWPFFTYNHNTSPAHTSISFPWPFVRYASGAYEERQFFPFYWSKTEGDAYRMHMILWPLYRQVTSYNARSNIHEETVSILVLNSKNKLVKNQVIESESLTVWPLWHTHDFPDHSTWYLPWIFPFHDEGFRKIYLPLLTLAQGAKTRDSSEVSILWKTISYTRQNTDSRFALSFIFSYERTQEYMKVGFLSDLLHWKWARNQEKE